MTELVFYAFRICFYLITVFLLFYSVRFIWIQVEKFRYKVQGYSIEKRIDCDEWLLILISSLVLAIPLGSAWCDLILSK